MEQGFSHPEEYVSKLKIQQLFICVYTILYNMIVFCFVCLFVCLFFFSCIYLLQVIQPVCNNLSPVVKSKGSGYSCGTTSATDQKHATMDTGDDWDGEDSLFEKLDLSKIVAESQGDRKQDEHQKNDNNIVQVNEAGDSGAIQLNNIQNVEMEFDSMDTWNTVNNKCSVTKTTVTIESNNAESKGDSNAQSALAIPSTSVTPSQEKWFSHIGVHSGQVQQGTVASKSNPHRTPTQDPSSSGQDILPLRAHLQRTPCQNNLNPKVDVDARTRDDIKTPPITSRSKSNLNANTAMQTNAQGLATSKPSPSNINITPDRKHPCETPQSTIANRLKQRLQKNAKVVTPVQNRAAQLRKASIDVAMSKAMEVQDRVTDKDVGPFYGLPSKVQELLKVHRGIEQLYGECSSKEISIEPTSS